LLFVGTAGFSYPDWIGPFYPPGTAPKKMFELYAAEFSFVEINSTYYHLPHWKMIDSLEKRSPTGFQFVFKAHRSITHERSPDSLTNCRLLCRALRPVISAGKIGGILVQFPYSFRNNEENRNYLLKLKEEIDPLPLIMEFRRLDWQTVPVYSFLQQNNISFVCVDEPQLGELMKPAVVKTSDIFYLRFHGRNRAKWWNHKKPYERYDYLYDQDELQQWLPDLGKLLQKDGTFFISFNNHFQAQAVLNARMMETILKGVLAQ
jgi:uncharacterized protein YecE (DUF72 family)